MYVHELQCAGGQQDDAGQEFSRRICLVSPAQPAQLTGDKMAAAIKLNPSLPRFILRRGEAVR